MEILQHTHKKNMKLYLFVFFSRMQNSRKWSGELASWRFFRLTSLDGDMLENIFLSICQKIHFPRHKSLNVYLRKKKQANRGRTKQAEKHFFPTNIMLCATKIRECGKY